MSRIDTPRKFYTWLTKKGLTWCFDDRPPFDDKTLSSRLSSRLRRVGGAKAVWDWMDSLPRINLEESPLDSADRHVLVKLPRGPFVLEADEYLRGDDDEPLRSIKKRVRTIPEAARLYEEFRLEAERSGRGDPGLVTGGRLSRSGKRLAVISFDGSVYSPDRSTMYLSRKELPPS